MTTAATVGAAASVNPQILVSHEGKLDAVLKRDDLIAEALLNLSYSNSDQDSADDEDESDFPIYDSNDSATSAEGTSEALAARAFMDFAESASSQLHEGVHLGRQRRKSSSTSAHTRYIRTPRFLQSPDRATRELLNSLAEDNLEFPDAATTLASGNKEKAVDWSNESLFDDEEEDGEKVDVEENQKGNDVLEVESTNEVSKHHSSARSKKTSSRYDLRLVRPYTCVVDDCRKSYTKRRGLLAHGKSVHPESIDLLKKVEPRLGGMDRIDDWSDEQEYGEQDCDSDVTDSNTAVPGKKRKRKILVEASEAKIVSPEIIVSEVDLVHDGKADTVKTKKRGRRLSASDFTSDSGGEGLLTVEAVEELGQRIAFLNDQKPFVCTHQNCQKRYRNANGLKYHLGLCFVGIDWGKGLSVVALTRTCFDREGTLR
ncbi:hypothetical protein BDR26DRAFT_869205 [Obelidium mucronatum]|nr:hypothetical protein BDR26DRAFT_869205 [Obelidium mucronatum]